MNAFRRYGNWMVIGAAVLGAVLSCNTVLTDVGGSTNDGTDFAQVDSSFTDVTQSPGGTGGTAEPAEDDVVLPSEETRSFFRAFQVDPVSEDSAGPKFVVSADVDQDGLLDLVSGWNQSQPIQLHLQRRDNQNNAFFRTVTIAGTSPTAVMAGVEVGQLDDDGWLDIVVLVKASGTQTFCPPETTPCTTDADCNAACQTDPNCTIVVQCGNRIAGVCDNFDDPSALTLLDGQIIVYFSPGDPLLIPDGDRWTEMTLVNPFVQDPWIHNQFPGKEEVSFAEGQTKPEWNGFTSLAVGDIDLDGLDDILVAGNPAVCKELSQDPPTNTVDLWLNPGTGLSRTPELWGAPPPDTQSRNVPVALMTSAAQVKDIGLMDVDSDGDLDVIATFTNSITQNLRWRRNPAIAHQAGGPSGRDEVLRGSSDGWRFSALGWEADARPIGQIDTDADVLAIGDVDNDGFDDVVVRSTIGQIVQWFRRPNALTIEPEFPPVDTVPDRFNFPWPVFTLAEMDSQEPEAIAVGDVTGDGRVEVIVAVEGAILWYDGTVSGFVYDPWSPNTIIQDAPGDAADTTTIAGTGTGSVQDPQSTGTTAGAGVGVNAIDTSTHVNALLVVDVDGDGRNDIIGTLDRRSGSGLSDDRLVWYRNIQSDEETPAPTRPITAR